MAGTVRRADGTRWRVVERGGIAQGGAGGRWERRDYCVLLSSEGRSRRRGSRIAADAARRRQHRARARARRGRRRLGAADDKAGGAAHAAGRTDAVKPPQYVAKFMPYSHTHRRHHVVYKTSCVSACSAASTRAPHFRPHLRAELVPLPFQFRGCARSALSLLGRRRLVLAFRERRRLARPRAPCSRAARDGRRRGVLGRASGAQRLVDVGPSEILSPPSARVRRRRLGRLPGVVRLEHLAPRRQSSTESSTEPRRRAAAPPAAARVRVGRRSTCGGDSSGKRRGPSGQASSSLLSSSLRDDGRNTERRACHPFRSKDEPPCRRNTARPPPACAASTRLRRGRRRRRRRRLE